MLESETRLFRAFALKCLRCRWSIDGFDRVRRESIFGRCQTGAADPLGYVGRFFVAPAAVAEGAAAMTLREMREARAKKVSDARAIHDRAEKESRNLTADESAEFDRIMAEVDADGERIERAERLERLSNPGDVSGLSIAGGDGSDLGRDASGPSYEERALALQAWALSGTVHRGEVGERHLRAAERCGVSLDGRELELRLSPGGFAVGSSLREREIRAQSSLVGASGGYLVPAGFNASLERAMLDFGGLMNIATVWRTATGNPVPWPTVNDTSNEGELIGENVAVSNQDVAVGSVSFGSRKISSKMILVPYELMRDSAFNLAAFLGSLIGERIARRANRMFTVGTGAGLEARGVVPASAVGVTAASASALTMDEAGFDLVNSVDPAYQSRGSFMGHSSTWNVIRKLKSGDGSYLWQPSLIVGQPDTFLGYPAIRNNQMATIAASARVMTFGDHSKYVVREVGSLRLKRLTERYGELDQDAFIGFMSYDGALVNAGTNPVKCLVMGA